MKIKNRIFLFTLAVIFTACGSTNQDLDVTGGSPIFITKPKFKKPKARDLGILSKKSPNFKKNVVTTF